MHIVQSPAKNEPLMRVTILHLVPLGPHLYICYIIIFMHQLLHLLSSKLAMNDQIVGHTEYKIHLRSDLGVYCPTSEFSVRSQNLVSDLRI